MLLTGFPSPSSLSSPSAGTERLGNSQLHSFKQSLLFQCEITHVHIYSHAQIDHKQCHLQAESGAATAILAYVLIRGEAACSLLPSQPNVKGTGLRHRWPQYLKTLGQRSNMHTDCINTKPKRGRDTSILLLCWFCNLFVSQLSVLPTRRTAHSLRSDFLMSFSWMVFKPIQRGWHHN